MADEHLTFLEEQASEAAQRRARGEGGFAWPRVYSRLTSRYDVLDMSEDEMRRFYETRQENHFSNARVQQYRTQFQNQEDVGELTEMVPVLGAIPATGRALNITASQNRIAAGSATEEDYRTLGRHLANIDRAGRRTLSEELPRQVANVGAYGAEFLMTGGAYRGVTGAVRGALPAATRQAPRLGTRFLTGIPGAAAQAAVQPRLPAAIARQRVAGVRQDQDGIEIGQQRGWGEAALRGYYETFAEMASERSGGFIAEATGLRRLAGRIGATRAVSALQRGIANRFTRRTGLEVTPPLLRRLGWHGILEEALEERVSEAATWPVLGEEYSGALGHGARGEWEQLGESLLLEGLTLGIYGGGMAAIQSAMAQNTLPRPGNPDYELMRQTTAMRLRQLSTAEDLESSATEMQQMEPFLRYFDVRADNIDQILAPVIQSGRDAENRAAQERRASQPWVYPESVPSPQETAPETRQQSPWPFPENVPQQQARPGPRFPRRQQPQQAAAVEESAVEAEQQPAEVDPDVPPAEAAAAEPQPAAPRFRGPQPAQPLPKPKAPPFGRRHQTPALIEAIRDVSPEGINVASMNAYLSTTGSGKPLFRQIFNRRNAGRKRKVFSDTGLPLDQVASSARVRQVLGSENVDDLVGALQQLAQTNYLQPTPEFESYQHQLSQWQEQQAQVEETGQTEQPQEDDRPFETEDGPRFFSGQDVPSINPQQRAEQQQQSGPSIRQIGETIMQTFEMPIFNLPRMQEVRKALYLSRPGAALINRMRAGSVPLQTHELGHHIQQRHQILESPSTIEEENPAAARGLRLFDYDPGRKDVDYSFNEGFAEYLRMYLTNQLGEFRGAATTNGMSLADIDAAIAYIEGRLNEADAANPEARLIHKLENLRGLITQFQGMSSLQQAAQELPLDPNQGPIEDTPEWLRRWTVGFNAWLKDAFVDDYGRLAFVTELAIKQGREFSIRPDDLWRHLRHIAPAWNDRWLFEGPFRVTFNQHGNIDQQRIPGGLSMAKILEGMTEAELTPIEGKWASKTSTFIVAQHIETEMAMRHEQLLDVEAHKQNFLMHERNSKDQKVVEKAKKVWKDAEKRVRAEPVSPEQREFFGRWLEEIRRDDPDFVARAKRVHERLTESFNLTLNVLNDLGMVREGLASDLVEARPDYIPLIRMVPQPGWQFRWGPRPGSAPGMPVRGRRGDANPILDPLIAYQSRVNLTTYLMQQQLKRLAFDDLHSGKDLGGYATQTDLKSVSAEASEQLKNDIFDALEAQNIDPQTANMLFGIMPGGVAQNYFTPPKWPKRGYPQIHVMREGEVRVYEVRDRLYYDLITSQQVGAGWARWINKAWPLKVLYKTQKWGATTASLAFQFSNVTRDAVTFARNTLDPNTTKDIPVWLGRAMHTMGQVANGKLPSDAVFRLFMRAGGGSFRRFGFENQQLGKDIKESAALVQSGGERPGLGKFRGSLEVMGAGELAPRVLEFNNALRAAGVNVAELNQKMLDDPHGDPITFAQEVMATKAARNVTVDFDKLGHIVRAFNALQPFFGPHITAMRDELAAMRDRPGRVAVVALVQMGFLEFFSWFMNKDKEWYRRLSDYDRRHWWHFELPTGWRVRLRRPLGLVSSALAGFHEMLRAHSDSNPQFGSWAEETFNELTPQLPLSVPGNLLRDFWRNRDWLNRPIAPPGQDRRPQDYLPHYAWHGLDVSLGGLPERTRRMASGDHVPAFPFIPNTEPSQPLQQFYEEFNEMRLDRQAAGQRNEAYPQEAEYQRRNLAHSLITELRSMRAGRGSEDPNERVPEAESDVANVLHRLRIAAAEATLGRIHEPVLREMDDLPQDYQERIRDWIGRVEERRVRLARRPTRRTREPLADYQRRRQEDQQQAERIGQLLADFGISGQQARRAMFARRRLRLSGRLRETLAFPEED